MAEEANKTELRVLFEESLKQPIKFSLFGNSVASEPVIKKAREETSTRSLSDFFMEAQAEIEQRWPEPVGQKFVKSTAEKRKATKAQLEVTREQLKEQSRRKLKAALRHGTRKGPKAVKAKTG